MRMYAYHMKNIANTRQMRQCGGVTVNPLHRESLARQIPCMPTLSTSQIKDRPGGSDSSGEAHYPSGNHWYQRMGGQCLIWV